MRKKIFGSLRNKFLNKRKTSNALIFLIKLFNSKSNSLTLYVVCVCLSNFNNLPNLPLAHLLWETTVSCCMKLSLITDGDISEIPV